MVSSRRGRDFGRVYTRMTYTDGYDYRKRTLKSLNIPTGRACKFAAKPTEHENDGFVEARRRFGREMMFYDHRKRALKSLNIPTGRARKIAGKPTEHENDGFVEARRRFWREMMVSWRRERDFGRVYIRTPLGPERIF